MDAEFESRQMRLYKIQVMNAEIETCQMKKQKDRWQSWDICVALEIARTVEIWYSKKLDFREPETMKSEADF